MYEKCTCYWRMLPHLPDSIRRSSFVTYEYNSVKQSMIQKGKIVMVYGYTYERIYVDICRRKIVCVYVCGVGGGGVT